MDPSTSSDQRSIFLSPSEERSSYFLLQDTNDHSQDIRIYISREILACYSPVFKTLFYGNFAEAKNLKDGLKLPDKSLPEILEFLSCLFPYPTKKKIDDSNASIVMKLADEYDVEVLRKKCAKYFMKQLQQLKIGDDTVLHYLADFSHYRLKNLIELCIPYAAALPFESLEKFRSNIDSKTAINNTLWMLIFEAKAHRLNFESLGHDLHCIAVKSLCSYCGSSQAMLCRNCSRKTCKNCRQKVCCGFHIVTCPASDAETNCDFVAYPCICGYKFDKSYLN